jgi:hypothetical protein
MKLKGILFAGIILLVTGIILRKASQLDLIGLVLIIVGVTMKISYIVIKAKRGEYQPGKELILLVAGLVLFFTGLYLRNSDPSLAAAIYLIVLGITLKLGFIIGFIRNVRSNNN